MENETKEQTETIYIPFYGGISEIEVITESTYTLTNKSRPQSEPLPSQLEKTAVKAEE